MSEGTIMPLDPFYKKWSERLRANEAEAAQIRYAMAAMESSLRRLWTAFSDLEQHLIDDNIIQDRE